MRQLQWGLQQLHHSIVPETSSLNGRDVTKRALIGVNLLFLGGIMTPYSLDYPSVADVTDIRRLESNHIGSALF